MKGVNTVSLGGRTPRRFHWGLSPDAVDQLPTLPSPRSPLAPGDRNDDFYNLEGMSAEVAELQAEVRKLTEIVRSLLKTVAELQAAKI